MFQQMDRMKREERYKEVRREVGGEPGIGECMELMDRNVLVWHLGQNSLDLWYIVILFIASPFLYVPLYSYCFVW